MNSGAAALRRAAEGAGAEADEADEEEVVESGASSCAMDGWMERERSGRERSVREEREREREGFA